MSEVLICTAHGRVEVDEMKELLLSKLMLLQSDHDTYTERHGNDKGKQPTREHVYCPELLN